MRKTIGKIMLGIIVAGMMAGCQDESSQVRNGQTAEFSKFEYGEIRLPTVMVYKLTIDFDKRIRMEKTEKYMDTWIGPSGSKSCQHQ